MDLRKHVEHHNSVRDNITNFNVSKKVSVLLAFFYAIIFFIRNDIKISDIIIDSEECCDYSWVSINELVGNLNYENVVLKINKIIN